MSTPQTPPQRLFFALWPPPELQRVLAEWAQTLQKQTGGRPQSPERIHATLAFIGAASAPQIEALLACGDTLSPPRSDLVLDQLGFWARNGVLWAGCRDPDPRLLAFADQLQQSLRRLGFRLEERPFRPHITLLRRARRRARSKIAPLVWPVNDFVLARSELSPQGSQYSILRRWSSAADVK